MMSEVFRGRFALQICNRNGSLYDAGPTWFTLPLPTEEVLLKDRDMNRCITSAMIGNL